MTIEMVQEFAVKFNLPQEAEPAFPAEHDMEFRLMRQAEEGDELHEAWLDNDLTGAFDALLDTAYIVFGTALRLGITPDMWNRGMAAVHAANMAKVRAQCPEQSKYKNTSDIVKPEGWTGPEETLKQILFG